MSEPVGRRLMVKYRAFSCDVTSTCSPEFCSVKLAYLRTKPPLNIEATDAEFVGKEDLEPR